jgi:hypothetical protein
MMMEKATSKVASRMAMVLELPLALSPRSTLVEGH